MMYPELYDTIKWFKSIYHYEMINEGWCFLTINFSMNVTFKIAPITYIINKKSQEESDEIASEYGWILNDNHEIISYDRTKHIRNKHLISTKELGLI